MNSIDLVGRLLATENISIVRHNCQTASFDIKSRVLTLPIWKNMTPQIESMFVSHEVGHALFTTDEYIDRIKSGEVDRGYINVVEDARIEKLMKRRYPGIRKTFFAGYKELIDQDFFDLKGKDLRDLYLIDKVNLFFKAGFSCGVRFNDEEKSLLNKVENVETMDDCIATAIEIFEYDKKLKETRDEERMEEAAFDQDEDSGEFDTDMDFDGESEFQDDDEETDQQSTTSAEQEQNNGTQEDSVTEEGTGKSSELPTSLTDSALNQKLQELADSSVQYVYHNLKETFEIDPIVSYKTILNETSEMTFDNYQIQTFNKFMIDSEKVVNYLVKEFEMRKSAQLYKRAQTSKVGSLNANKLYAYKINDDIFKRLTTLPQGKNHGMIFLLDWSGSMRDTIESTVKQVINLAMFCRRINIPFEVYAFSSSYSSFVHTPETRSFLTENYPQVGSNTLYSDGHFNLLQLFSNKMTNSEFKTMAKRFTSYNIFFDSRYNLGSTPLSDSLVYMLNYIPKFKKQNAIEKLSFITLTDGASHPLCYTDNVRNYSWSGSGVDYKRISVKNFLKDPVTGKTYQFTDDTTTQTNAILGMIKDRYDVTILGFYICINRTRAFFDAVRDNVGSRKVFIDPSTVRSDCRKNGYYSLKGSNHDDLFLILDNNTKIVDEDLVVDSKTSAAAIARKFGKTLKNRMTSRILLDRFIGYVA